jgi:hypothetical protein
MFGKIESVTLTKEHGNLHKICARKEINILASVLILTEIDPELMFTLPELERGEGT